MIENLSGGNSDFSIIFFAVLKVSREFIDSGTNLFKPSSSGRIRFLGATILEAYLPQLSKTFFQLMPLFSSRTSRIQNGRHLSFLTVRSPQEERYFFCRRRFIGPLTGFTVLKTTNTKKKSGKMFAGFLLNIFAVVIALLLILGINQISEPLRKEPPEEDNRRIVR